MTLSKAVETFDHLSLQDLARRFFERLACEVRESVSVKGNCNFYEFDFLLSRKSTAEDSLTIGVVVKDWARSCGINVIIDFEHVLKDMQSTIQRGLLVTNQVSSMARLLAQKAGILLLSRGELVSIFHMDPNTLQNQPHPTFASEPS
ncbi:MAG: restriction endonuclease [Candidatus Thorarchaeota archaeon]